MTFKLSHFSDELYARNVYPDKALSKSPSADKESRQDPEVALNWGILEAKFINKLPKNRPMVVFNDIKMPNGSSQIVGKTVYSTDAQNWHQGDAVMPDTNLNGRIDPRSKDNPNGDMVFKAPSLSTYQVSLQESRHRLDVGITPVNGFSGMVNRAASTKEGQYRWMTPQQFHQVMGKDRPILIDGKPVSFR